MNRNSRVSVLLFFALIELLDGVPAETKYPPFSGVARAQEAPPGVNFSPDQLDNLLAPVALYPDPILAQLLIASTFSDEVEEASRWWRAQNDPEEIESQPWDLSVKAIAHYPPLLEMMSDQLDWTQAVGQAYVNQASDVMSSVQRLRSQAYRLGNLVSNDRQEVLLDGDMIRIVPLQPDLVYLPTYDPGVIYSLPASGIDESEGGDDIYFGAGFPIGVWLILDCDWPHHRLFYHGWRGGGWIARSRPRVREIDGYIDERNQSIRINRDIIHRSVNATNLNHFNAVHRDVGYDTLNRRTNPIPAEKYDAGNRLIRRNIDVSDPRLDQFRGHLRAAGPSPSPAGPPSRPYSVFRGGRSPLDPQSVLQRGQSSRALAAPAPVRPPANPPMPPEGHFGGYPGRKP